MPPSIGDLMARPLTHMLSSTETKVIDALNSEDPAKIKSALEFLINRKKHLAPLLDNARKHWDKTYEVWRKNSGTINWSTILHPSLFHYSRKPDFHLNILHEHCERAQGELNALIDKNNKYTRMIKTLKEWHPQQPT